MRLGFNLPHMGPAASADSIVTVAKKAEELGYDSLWVTERLLFPVAPRTPYGGTPDGSLPEVYRTVLDPLETLTFVAAETNSVALGTSVLDMPYYNPVMLARRLTTLDVLSGGRLRVGLGQGWSVDEHEAAGASMKGRGARADEFLDVLHAIWKTDPVEYSGRHFTIAKSHIQPKPVQRPHPPIYLAAFSPTALKRVATKADGWLPVGPFPMIAQMWEGLTGMAREAGRDPGKLELVIRANALLSDEALPEEGRFPFMGSSEQIKADLAAARELGAAEVHFDPSFSDDGLSLDGFVRAMERIRELDG
ncbi:MAG: LLM class F420-dependent oxidoreductase [Dehalococcoidia bacterium]